MDDLQAALEGVAGSGLDRVREDRTAGSLALSMIALYFIMVFAAFFRFGIDGAMAAFVVGLVVFIPFVFIPFRMPRYEADEAPLEMSNYPR